MNYLFIRAKQIYSAEGSVSLLKQGLAFLSSFIFNCQTYYTYRDPIQSLRLPNEVDVLPRVGDLTFRVVATNREADELEADGFEFRSQVSNARERLDRGATAFCIFVGQQFAHIGWIALTQEAADSLDAASYKVRLTNCEAYASAMWTNPKYRRLGIHGYGYFKRLEFMQAKGIHTERSVVARGNVAPRRSSALSGMSFPGPHAKGRSIRVLWWKSWRERPLTQGSGREQRNAHD